jgi:C-terminal processing protease CtpA/Prc
VLSHSTTRRPALIVLSLLSLYLVQAVALAQMSGQDRSRARKMLKQLRQDVEKHYYDPTYGGVDLEAAYQDALHEIEAVNSLPEAFDAIARFMDGLGDSHTFFVPPLSSSEVDYGFEASFVGDTCFITEVKEGGPAAKVGIRVGDAVPRMGPFNLRRENLTQVEYQLHVLYPQQTLGVVIRSPDGAQRPVVVVSEFDKIPFHTIDPSNPMILRWLKDRAHDLAEENAHVTVEVGEHVIVWKMTAFDWRPIADKVIDKARKRRALVLDLRGNTGGGVDVLQRVIGRLFEETVTIGRIVTRKGEKEEVAKPRGGKPFLGELIVLVDSRSGSASEILARVVQLRGRGVVMGDRTAGAVMTSRLELHKVGFKRYWQYGASIAISDVIMEDGGRLEGVGVVPDAIVLPTSLDLREGRDPVMVRALARVGVEIDPILAARIYEKD